jgi:hypothetical protein
MKNARVSLFLAGRTLARSNYGIAAATTLMMLLIYVSLLFLPSLIQGAINRVNAQLIDTVTSNIVITPQGKGTGISNVSGYLAQIRRTAGVAEATAVFHAGTQVSYRANAGSWPVDAIDPGSFGERADRHLDRRRDLRQPVPAVRQQRLHHRQRGREAAARQRRPRHHHLRPHQQRHQRKPGSQPAQRTARRDAVPDLGRPGYRRGGSDRHLPADQQHPQGRLAASGCCCSKASSPCSSGATRSTSRTGRSLSRPPATR